MKTFFVVNPAAGHGRGRARWQEAETRLPSGAWKAAWTERSGDGERLAREALEAGFEAIVAVGGDGTLNEVVNGFLSAPAALRLGRCVGAWPSGSGCDFARHYGLRGDLGALRALLERGVARPIDAGLVEFKQADAVRRRYFINEVSFGLAGEVARRVQGGGKPLGGTLSYLAGSVAAVWATPAREMELVADGAPLPRGRYHLVALANTSTTGGGMRIAPGADAEDGRLDLVLVGDLSRWQLLRRLPYVYFGRHLGMPGVTHRLVSRLEARSASELTLNIDGESLGALPASFEVAPRALPFLLPA